MKFLERHQGWIQWGSAIVVVCVLHFADARYVTKVEYSEDRKALLKSVAEMSTAIVLLQQNGKNLEDHEQRLRFLEQHRSKANLNYENEIPAHDAFAAPAARDRADR